jgi:hypothetical protein
MKRDGPTVNPVVYLVPPVAQSGKPLAQLPGMKYFS